MPQGHDIRLASFEITKSSDSVWHKGLLSKLKSNRIDGLLFKVVADFLCQRSIRVVLDSFPSKERPVLYLVLQGSLLWPTLFLVFINYQGDKLVKNPHNFADEMRIIISIRKDEDQRHPHKELKANQKIEVEADKWLVSFNA